MLARVTRVTSFVPAPNAGENARFCLPDTAISLDVLPFGERYFIGVKPAAFGKAEFKLEFTDAGLLKTVSLNSDARTAESVKEVSGLLGTLLPYLAVQKSDTAPKGVVLSDLPEANDVRDTFCLRSKVTIAGFEEARPGSINR